MDKGRRQKIIKVKFKFKPVKVISKYYYYYFDVL